MMFSSAVWTLFIFGSVYFDAFDTHFHLQELKIIIDI